MGDFGIAHGLVAMVIFSGGVENFEGGRGSEVDGGKKWEGCLEISAGFRSIDGFREEQGEPFASKQAERKKKKKKLQD